MPKKKKKKQRGPNHICGLVGEGEETWTRFMEPIGAKGFFTSRGN
jgi:hypothetical protein